MTGDDIFTNFYGILSNQANKMMVWTDEAGDQNDKSSIDTEFSARSGSSLYTSASGGRHSTRERERDRERERQRE